MTPIFVALDTQDVHRAAAIARDIGGLAAGLKLGLEFFCANGEDGVLRIAEHETPVFLDLKFHDIPNTVEGAVQAIAHLDPAILTVHAAGGRAMMRAAKAAAPPRTKVVAVTVLTSLDEDDLSSIGIDSEPASQVERLAVLARESKGSTGSSARAPRLRRYARRGPMASSLSRECGPRVRSLAIRNGSSLRIEPSPTARRRWSSDGPSRRR